MPRGKPPRCETYGRNNLLYRASPKKNAHDGLIVLASIITNLKWLFTVKNAFLQKLPNLPNK